MGFWKPTLSKEPTGKAGAGARLRTLPTRL